MADYWKSQPRHFCEFCKCWIADNKPSRDFHEKGKKHQVNVEKKIAEVRKKGIKKAEKEEEENSTLKQIEKAALKALKDDLKRDPSLASQYGVEIKDTALSKLSPTSKPSQAAQKANKPGPSRRTEDPVPVPVPEVETTPVEETVAVPQINIQDWSEAKSAEGYTYYWNCVTNEVTWIKPEGYVSLEERDVTENPPEQQSEQQSPTEEQEVTSTTDLQESTEQPAPVENVNIAFEPSDIAAIPLPGDIANIPLPGDSKDTKEEDNQEVEKEEEEKKEEEVPAPAVPRPARIERKPAPYGSWETVENKEEEHVDLQLPEVKEQPVAKVISISEPKIKFREKKVDTLGAELVAFKKRKLNTAGLKLRKREEDDS